MEVRFAQLEQTLSGARWSPKQVPYPGRPVSMPPSGRNSKGPPSLADENPIEDHFSEFPERPAKSRSSPSPRAHPGGVGKEGLLSSALSPLNLVSMHSQPLSGDIDLQPVPPSPRCFNGDTSGTGGTGSSGVASAGSTARETAGETAKSRARSQESQSVFSRGMRVRSAASKSSTPGTSDGNTRPRAASQPDGLTQLNTALQNAGQALPNLSRTSSVRSQTQRVEWTL